MFNLYDIVSFKHFKNESWKIVDFSDSLCSTDKLPMVKLISNGRLTFAKQSDLVLQ